MRECLRTVLTAGIGALLAVAPAVAAFPESNDAGQVLTWVCRVTITYKDKAGTVFSATSCIDARYSCNDTPGVGVCGQPNAKGIVSRTCVRVGLSMCRSE